MKHTHTLNFLFYFLFPWFTSACAGATLHEMAIQHNARAVELIQTGELRQARAGLEVALEYNPRFSEAHANLGLIAMREGRLDAAEAHLQRAVTLNGDFAEAWTNLASISLYRGSLEGALERARRAISVDPDYPEARIALIRSLVRTGQHGEAENQARRLLAVRPHEARSYAVIALVAFANRHHDEAETAISRAFELEDRHPLAHEVRGRLLLSQGRASLAVPDLAIALSARPADINLRYFHALALLQAGQVIAASEHLTRLLDDHPSHARALTAMALIFAARHDVERAHEFLLAALTAQPGLSEALVICHELGQSCPRIPTAVHPPPE